MMRGLFSRLETTPGQEKVIATRSTKVRESMRRRAPNGATPRSSRAFCGARRSTAPRPKGVSGKADASFAKVRVVVVEALAQIHEALDDRQRRILADFIESRGRGCFGGGLRSVAVARGGNDERWV